MELNEAYKVDHIFSVDDVISQDSCDDGSSQSLKWERAQQLYKKFC